MFGFLPPLSKKRVCLLLKWGGIQNSTCNSLIGKEVQHVSLSHPEFQLEMISALTYEVVLVFLLLLRNLESVY